MHIILKFIHPKNKNELEFKSVPPADFLIF